MAELIAELVGFVVMLFVLWKYVLPPVGNMVRKRQDEVQRQVDEAEEATRKLEDARGRLDNAVQRADAEGARIRDDARADATRIREELKEQAEAEVERMLQRGREQLVGRAGPGRARAARRAGRRVDGAGRADRSARELDDDGARSATVESFLSEIESLPSPRGSVRATTGGGA